MVTLKDIARDVGRAQIALNKGDKADAIRALDAVLEAAARLRAILVAGARS